MEKVLLAIDGIAPDRKVFSYAVQLCQRLKTGLKVIQIIRPGSYSGYFSKVKERVHSAGRYIEDSMVAATFAEAGEPETANDMMEEALKNINKLLPESEKAGIPCSMTMKSGNPNKEIIKYVKKHRDVVLTIYDPNGGGHDARGVVKKKNTVPMEIKRALSIPVVIISC